MSAKDKLYSGTELAQEFDLTPQALRFYEEKGLLQPARMGIRRVYTYRDRARLLLIQRLRRLGFSLEDIVQYLSMYGSVGGGQYQLGLEKIEHRMAELLRMRSEIDQTIAELQNLEQEARQKLAAAEHRPRLQVKPRKGTEEPA
ncbi:MAG: MerR family transcriptional regulator [Magnetospirillum sp.]|nr:MerR family transcriptional regulator [Magnetospirillum sp.]